MTTPCQSNAAAMRLVRSPPGGKERRDHQEQHQPAQRIRIARGNLRHRRAGLERAGAHAARAPDARATARRRTGRRPRAPCGRRSPWPAGAAAGCCRSSRRKPVDRADGQRTRNSGTVAATARTKKSEQPDRRGRAAAAHSQRPSQDSARNRPTAVAIEASAGQSRSQRIDQPGTPTVRATSAASAGSERRRSSPGRSGLSSLKAAPEPENSVSTNTLAWARVRHNPSKTQASPSVHSQAAGDRDRSIGRLQGGAGPGPIRHPEQGLPGSAARVL